MRAYYSDDEVVSVVADVGLATIKLAKVGDIVRYFKPDCIKTPWPIEARAESMLLRGAKEVRWRWARQLTDWLKEWYSSLPQEVQNNYWGFHQCLFDGWGDMELHMIEHRLLQILKWAWTVR